MGDITGDLSSRRGQVNGSDHVGAGQVIVRGQAPLSELAGYQLRLNAMTSGQGHYTLALSHYDAVPPTVQQQLVGQFRVREED
jgi:elongation factor G